MWAALEGLPLLEELDLAHNRIVSVTPRAAMPILHIDASHNELTELPPLGFLRRLTRLKINDNQIAHLPADAFAALVDLQELFLGNNRLGTLDQSSFTNMDSLRMLSVPGNDLASVSADLMSSMTNLDVLDISNNSLKSLPSGFFEPVFLSYFYGYQNQWICDCSVAYFWEWMHDMNDDKVYNSLLQKDIESILCSDHGPHSATPLYNLDKDSFCPATHDPSTNVAIPTFPIPVVKTTPRPATTASPSAPTTVQGKPTTAFQKMTTVSSTTAEMTTAQVTNVPSTVRATLRTTVEASTAVPSAAATRVKTTPWVASTGEATASRVIAARAQTTTRSSGDFTNATRVQTTLATAAPATTTARAVATTAADAPSSTAAAPATLHNPTTSPRQTTAALGAALTRTSARSRATPEGGGGGGGGEPTTARRDATVEGTATARTSASARTQRWCLCRPEEAAAPPETSRENPCDNRFRPPPTEGGLTDGFLSDASLSDALVSHLKRLTTTRCLRYGIFPWLLHLIHALLFLALIFCILQLRGYLVAERHAASCLTKQGRRRPDYLSRRFQHEIINHPLNLRHRRQLPMGEGTLPSVETKPFVFRLRHVPEKDPGPEVSIVYC
ncbi:uncharacterized protein LOC116946965 [Petromyzon marinus]|uniref:uncharacterized protein LOC116946965 n=1 Tax=Petromyzon marinus TaxID=7757 RepID=UPI003F726B1F